MKNIFFVFIISNLFCACGNVNSVKCSDYNLDENCCPQYDSLVFNQKKYDLNSINFFLETSGSMSGYMPSSNDATKFQISISDLLSTIGSELKDSIFIKSISDASKTFEDMDQKEARNNILKGKFDWSGNTYLPTMLNAISSEYLRNDNVNILISDLIYSPERAKMKEVALTTTDIRATVETISKDYVSVIYSIKSQFVKKKSTIDESPFYMLIQGKQDNVNSVKDFINQSSQRNKNEFDYVEFGLNYKNFYYSILPYTEATANFIAMPCEKFDNAYISIQLVDFGDEAVTFWVGLDLSNLPDYSKKLPYLLANFQVEVSNGNAEIIDYKESPFVGITSDDLILSEKCSHFVKIKISKSDEIATELKMSLKYTRPDWVNSLNEESNENNRSKTFGISKVIAGFEQAYKLEENPYLFKDISIALIKE